MTHTGTNRDRYALITGGGSGLGRELCRVFAHDGFAVAIVGLHHDSLEQTLQIVERAGGAGRTEVCDVTDLAAWRALRERLQTDWPRLDLLINNAGMFSSGFVGRLNLAEVERVLRLNLFGAIYGCDTMVPWLVDSAARAAAQGTRAMHRAGAQIVNISSIYGYLNPPGMSAYNVSKAAIVSFSETLRGELAPHGVGVTLVCPGPMPTRFVAGAHFESDAFRRMTERVVAESTLQPHAVAAAVRRAVERNDLYCMMGTRERWYWRFKRWFPRTVLAAAARRVRQDLDHHS